MTIKPEEYLDLVESAVLRVAGSLPWLHDDFCQDGALALALVQAAKRFNPARGVEFSTYAWRRVCGAIRDSMRRMDPLSRSHRRELRETDDPTEQLTLSLDALDPKTELSLHGVIQDPGPNPEELAMRSEVIERVRQVRSRLPARLRKVLELRYDDTERTLNETGREIGVGGPRVWHLEKVALQRVRRRLAAAA